MRFKMEHNVFLKILVLISLISHLNAFYLPGLAPVNYCEINKETDTCKFNICNNNNLSP